MAIFAFILSRGDPKKNTLVQDEDSQEILVNSVCNTLDQILEENKTEDMIVTVKELEFLQDEFLRSEAAVQFHLDYLVSKYPYQCLPTSYAFFYKNKQIELRGLPTSDLGSLINKCQGRFLFLTLFIRRENGTGHANLIIIDKHKKTIERFEPAGCMELDLEEEEIEDKLQTFFNSVDEYKYFSPTESNVYCGIQVIECRDKRTPFVTGFCIYWSLLFLEFRVRFANQDSQKIQEQLIECFQKNSASMRNYMDEYTRSLAKRAIIRNRRKSTS